tara:strand:- start:197 stop:742 length:546 start_codon:yes stop_codon:yes gene_type:complete
MKEYILEIKKVIPKTICDKIIKYFDNNYKEAKTTGLGVNKNIRNCLTRNLMNTKSFGETICLNATKEKIFECVTQYKKKFDVNIEDITQLDLLKYEANEFEAGYNFHCDFGPKCMERCLSISICLNNEYTGGEFVFDCKDGRYVVPQNVGDAVIFPSNFIFPHQVNKVLTGTRYALIGWVL